MIFLALKTKDGRITWKISFYCQMLGSGRYGFYKYLANRDRDITNRYDSVKMHFKQRLSGRTDIVLVISNLHVISFFVHLGPPPILIIEFGLQHHSRFSIGGFLLIYHTPLLTPFSPA